MCREERNVKENKEEYQKEYQDKEYNRKLKYLAGIVVITFSVYVSFKYLLVYVWPFVLGVLAALLLEKPVNSIYMWICKRIRLDKRKVHAQRIKEHRIKSIIATIIMLIISVVIIILLAAAVITGANEISDFLKNWDYNTIGIRQQTARICLEADDFLGLDGGCCLDTLIMCGRRLAGIMPEKIFHISVPVIKNIVIVAGGLVVGFISVIYLSTDMDEIRTQIRDSVFVEEIRMLWHEVKRLINVYFKVELRIMFINSAISMAAFFIIKSPYAVMLGIIVGVVDALPVFGTGTILIPWMLFNLIMKNFLSAVVVLVTYVITYFVREIMESKCMGDKLGISPFAMLVIIFVGLLVYGISGFITGPVSFVIIKALVLRLRCVMKMDEA